MRPSELEKLFRLEDSYWWFVARRRLLRDLLLRHRPAPSPEEEGRPLRILDVGCGTGATLRVLEQLGSVVGLDRSRDALGFSRRRGRYQLVRAQGSQAWGVP